MIESLYFIYASYYYFKYLALIIKCLLNVSKNQVKQNETFTE